MDRRDKDRIRQHSGPSWNDRGGRKRSRSPSAPRDDRRRRSRSPVQRNRMDNRSYGHQDNRNNPNRNNQRPRDQQNQGRNQRSYNQNREVNPLKLREVYVGNLAGVIPVDVLEEFFNRALELVAPVAVVNINIDKDKGNFAFVQLQSPDLVKLALAVLKDSELLGQRLRLDLPQMGKDGPSITQPPCLTPQELLDGALERRFPSCMTEYVMLEGVPAVEAGEVEELAEEIRRECARQHIRVDRAFVEPGPSTDAAQPAEGSRRQRGAEFPDPESFRSCSVFLQLDSLETALCCREMMSGRRLNDNIINARFISEETFKRAAASCAPKPANSS